jgi:hypothetical protein
MDTFSFYAFWALVFLIAVKAVLAKMVGESRRTTGKPRELLDLNQGDSIYGSPHS